MPIEISFPRGGRKPPTHKTAQVSKVKYDLFGKKKPKHKNRDLRNEMGPIKTIDDNICPAEIIKTTADLTSYRTIQEGMVMMGCIREIQKMTLSVLLPGRISGRVMITQISAPYTRLLHAIAANDTPEGFRQVRDIVHPGQYVATKVMKIDSDDDKFQVGLSIAPHDVNSELNYTSVSAGMLLWGAVSGCEEHGYVIDLGVQNCRAFLPKANVDENKTYAIGELLWCIVQKCDTTGVASTVTINALKSKIESNKIIKETSLDNLLPGMQVDFTITKVLGNGVEGKFLNDYTGYVHEGYLQGILDKLGSYKVGQVVSARIMYVTPVTKLSFLTFRGFGTPSHEDILDGSLINGTILNVTRGGLYVKINKTLKGFVSFKRLKTGLAISSDLDYNDLVKKNYQIGSQHQCRVLSYDCMEQVFICTMEKELLKEKIFSYTDLKPGQNVTVEIKEVQKNGLYVQAGRITGFILNEHLSDVTLPSYTNMKNKFNPGQKLKTKVWSVNEQNSSLLFTIKPSLLSVTDCLTSYEEAEHNKQFPGMIVQITKNGILVTFFGNVKGWIPKNQLSFEKVTRPDLMFKIGQIVNCTVIKCNVQARKLSLSLQPPKAKSKRKKLRLGQHVDVKVNGILHNALEVEIIDTQVGAVVPAQHLTHCPRLAELMLETYSVGDVLNDLVVVNVGRGVPILSLRERELTEENIINFSDVEPDTIVRCSVSSVNDKCMLLQCPITEFEKLIVVSTEHICEINKKPKNIDIKKNQCMYAKILQVKNKSQNVYASTELSKCWEGDLTDSKELLLKYLADINHIKKHWIANKKPIMNYKVGEMVTGTVTHLNKNGTATVSLPNEVDGKIDSRHRTEDISIGDVVKGLVIWHDFKHNCVELTIKPSIISRINQKQTGQINIKVGKNAIGDILLVKRDFVLVSLRGSGNRQLAYLPTKLHINDLLPNTRNYNIGDEIKVEIQEIENGDIVGISKELLKNFEKAKKALKRARKVSESEEGSKKKKRKKNKKDKLVKPEQNEDSDAEMEQDSTEEAMDTSEIDNEEDESEIEEQVIPVKETKKAKKDNKPKSKAELIVENIKEEVAKEKKAKKDKKKQPEKKIEEDSDSETEIKLKTNDVAPILSGVNDFWSTPAPAKVDEESSDDEVKVEEDANKKQKKKKLTPAERAEQARIEEERLRKIETELADTDSAPKSADQFDRLVLANPSSSLLWISYIAFHLEGTEIEKARAVARKALNTIEFREEQEKLNVWIAFLNLENRYGSKESFSSILEEAIKMNDSLTVHLQALNILAESNKTTEFLELLGTVTRRYKQVDKMWTGAAEACYKCEQKEQARNLMQKAVKSLEEKQHINVIVQFAFMESKWGEPERAEAILEKVLASYPRRVDVWCSYVDMLIKANRIHIAKNVLERAVSQKLPPRKMKTIFSKFVQFETKFGDEESVKKVRQLASDYVKEALK